MTRLLRCCLALTLTLVGPLAAQGSGGLIGRVVDATNDRPIRGVEVRLDNGRLLTLTDSAGEYRFRSVPSGGHTFAAALPGYRPARRDDINVRAGEVTRVDIRLAPLAVAVADLVAVGVQDPVLDPMATATAQRMTGEEMRRLPISTLEDAIAIQAGVVGESYRGGRAGQQAFILDGFGVKNQLDASTGSSGLRIPPDIITEASLVTNGFSAKFGQAISGLINVTTKDGGDAWRGRLAYETDRPLGGSADLGLDRFVIQGDGPLVGRIKAMGIIDLAGQLDADPANAPPPENPLDPRFTTPAPIPHNSGETWTAGGKLTIPVGTRVVGRVFGLATTEQRYLFDPQYKYNTDFAPGRRIDGKLVTGHVQLLPPTASAHPILGDLRIGYFNRTFLRGAVDAPDYTFGAFTGKRLSIRAEELAKAQDTVATRVAVPGFETPQPSSNTPWGVPAFFVGDASNGEIAYTKFSELRTQLDVSITTGTHSDLYVGGMYAMQDVKTFHRVLAYQPVGTNVPRPVASSFSPVISGLYVEGQGRASDLGFTAGVRFDGFDPGIDLANRTLKARSSINPRIAVSTVLAGATLVGSVGHFSQPPDLQYLVDAAFDDSTRTGRFRQGNPDLGFESSTQFELSVRARLASGNSLKVNVYNKRLDGLVASTPINVNPDSSVFVNADVGNVVGAEIIFERERRHGWGARVAGVVQKAEATVTDAFQLHRLATIDPVTGDTIPAARNQFPLDYDRRVSLIMTVDGEFNQRFGPTVFGTRPFALLTMALIGRYASGLPYTRTNAAGDSLIGPLNGARLPSTMTFDMLIRRPLHFGRYNGGLYLDMRNLANTRNQLSVRRDTGTPFPDNNTITALAEKAYNADPNPIPYESQRYRRSADTNNDGVIAGHDELFPLYMAAAKDFTSPLFQYGPPRIVRFGLEIVF